MRRDEFFVADLVDNARAVRAYLGNVTRERWDAMAIMRAEFPDLAPTYERPSDADEPGRTSAS